MKMSTFEHVNTFKDVNVSICEHVKMFENAVNALLGHTNDDVMRPQRPNSDANAIHDHSYLRPP
jgi:hypothetical protein